MKIRALAVGLILVAFFGLYKIDSAKAQEPSAIRQGINDLLKGQTPVKKATPGPRGALVVRQAQHLLDDAGDFDDEARKYRKQALDYMEKAMVAQARAERARILAAVIRVLRNAEDEIYGVVSGRAVGVKK